MPFEEVIQGFKKWPEKTATSPSGQHLGIYKTLLKDQHHEQPGRPVTTKGINIMQDVHQLLVLAKKNKKTWFYLLSLVPLHCNSELRPTYHCEEIYGGLSRFFAVEFVVCLDLFFVRYCWMSLFFS